MFRALFKRGSRGHERHKVGGPCIGADAIVVPRSVVQHVAENVENVQPFALETRARGTVGREASGQGGEVLGEVGAARGRGCDVGHDPVFAALRVVWQMIF